MDTPIPVFIDFHVHLAPGLGDEMARSGVDRVVAMSAISGRGIYTPTGRVRRTTSLELLEGNEEVMQAATEDPRLIPFVRLAPRVQDAAATLQGYAQRGCLGIKLHPVLDHYSLLDPGLDPILESATRLRLPVMVHTGWRPTGSVRDVGELARRYPDLRFVVAHMKEEWGVNRRLSHIEVAESRPNVWLECSYAEHPRRIGEAVTRLGADRILFGSDWPLGGGHIAWDMTRVTYAPITEEDKAKILGENARRFLSL